MREVGAVGAIRAMIFTSAEGILGEHMQQSNSIVSVANACVGGQSHRRADSEGNIGLCCTRAGRRPQSR
jgi:hypothetical protein